MTSKSALIVTVLAIALLAAVTSAAQSGESMRSCQLTCDSDVNESTTFKSYCIPDQLLSTQQVVPLVELCTMIVKKSQLLTSLCMQALGQHPGGFWMIPAQRL